MRLVHYEFNSLHISILDELECISVKQPLVGELQFGNHR